MEQRMTGTFYGVSVGPGNPELLTLQAVRLLRQCPVLAAPQTASGQMLALDIARRALGSELDGKTILPLQFAMSRDAAVLRASHETAASAVRPFLDAGQDVAMLNLGDVSIYATFGYLQEILQAQGYATAMAAGVPSFCAAAARQHHQRLCAAQQLLDQMRHCDAHKGDGPRKGRDTGRQQTGKQYQQPGKTLHVHAHALGIGFAHLVGAHGFGQAEGCCQRRQHRQCRRLYIAPGHAGKAAL